MILSAKAQVKSLRALLLGKLKELVNSPPFIFLLFPFLIVLSLFQTVDGHFDIERVISIVHSVDGLCVRLLVDYFA